MKALARIVLALALILPIMGEAALGAFMSGHRLHERCRSPEVVGQAMCMGFALGVVDENPALMRCARGSVEVLQIVDAVKRHLERYPSDRDFPGHVVVRLAMGEAWPCDP